LPFFEKGEDIKIATVRGAPVRLAPGERRAAELLAKSRSPGVDSAVIIKNAEREIGATFTVSDGFLEVDSIEAGSPAEAGNLRVGDVMVSVQGEKAQADLEWLERKIQGVSPEQLLGFVVSRAGNEISVSVNPTFVKREEGYRFYGKASRILETLFAKGK